MHIYIFYCTFAVGMNKELLYKELEEWYEMNHRILPWRETDDPYKIWISEIILQQTRVAQGMEYYHRLITRFPDIQSLADAEEDEVLLYWQGLGYYSRARNLHKAAQLMKNHLIFHQAMRLLGDEAKGEKEGDEAIRRKVKGEEIFAALKSMPGVGDYTAGAIASFAFDLPYPALDGNVYRVLSRLYDCEIAFDTTEGKKHFRQLAIDLLDKEHPRLFNSAIMELGALVCLPTKPMCDACPLSTWCKALVNNTVELLPVRKPRPKLRNRYLEYTIYITPDNTTLIHQRKGNDIWKHLWEFVFTEHTDEASWVNNSNHPSDLTHTGKALELTHVLSHQKLFVRFVLKKVPTLPKMADTIVVRLSDLDNYAFSRLTIKALEYYF